MCCWLRTLCHTIQHRAVPIIFRLNLQTITITRMLSSGGERMGRKRGEIEQSLSLQRYSGGMDVPYQLYQRHLSTFAAVPWKDQKCTTLNVTCLIAPWELYWYWVMSQWLPDITQRKAYFIEETISETKHFSERIQPRVKDGEKCCSIHNTLTVDNHDNTTTAIVSYVFTR